jgi:hypothetical protein
MRNSPLLDNGSVNMFPWQRIDAVSDELFKRVIKIWFASKLQKKLQSAPVQFTTELRGVQSSPKAEDNTLACVW